MSTRSKCRKVSTNSGGEKAIGAEKSKESLRTCLLSIHDITRRYFYHISAKESAPGCLSYLLGVSEENLVEILKLCGFCKSNDFRDWVVANFDVGTVEITEYQKNTLIKIGIGVSPERPSIQLKDGLEPPKFRMQSTIEGQSSKDSLMLLFNKPPPTDAAATTATTTPAAAAATPAAAAALLLPRVPHTPVKMTQKFNIETSDRGKLAMELVCDMDTPQRAPLLRELVKGPKFALDALNNQRKNYVFVPQCSNEASAMQQNSRHQFVQEIADTFGAGAETVIDGLHKGALWLCRIMAQLYKDEYAHSAARAGVSCISRMSPKATAAMFTAAKLTKAKSRIISAHLSAWCKQPITAKETDVDALAGKQYVKRKYDKHRMTLKKGKKQSADDIKSRQRDISIEYWVSNPSEAAEDELINRLRDSDDNKPINGFKFPLLDIPVIVACFLADHGNVAWRAGLTIIASEQDGQGEPVKVAHLLGKDSYDVLLATAQPILNEGLSQLQDSALLVIRNNAESDDDVQQECMLVPRTAFINSYSDLFRRFFMLKPTDSDNHHQKVLIDSAELNGLAQSGGLLYDCATLEISGASWRNAEQEVTEKKFRDGRVVKFSDACTVEMYPIVVLGSGDTEWVSCALGKENMAGAHCNHCNRSTVDFHLGRGDLWTLESIAETAKHFKDVILPGIAHRRKAPVGHNGVKRPSMFCIPVHLWVSPILHNELGLVKDWLTRVEKFCDCRIETVSEKEVQLRDELIILGDALEELLIEQAEISPKETIKDYKAYLKTTEQEIANRSRQIPNEAGHVIRIPAMKTPAELHLIANLKWEIDALAQQAKDI